MIEILSPLGSALIALDLYQKQLRELEARPLRSETESFIVRKAEEYGLPAERVVAIAKCESGLNPQALNHTERERSRGIFQINEYAHPSVTDAQAFDLEWNVEWSLQHMAAGRWSMWSCSKLVARAP